MSIDLQNLVLETIYLLGMERFSCSQRQSYSLGDFRLIKYEAFTAIIILNKLSRLILFCKTFSILFFSRAILGLSSLYFHKLPISGFQIFLLFHPHPKLILHGFIFQLSCLFAILCTISSSLFLIFSFCLA